LITIDIDWSKVSFVIPLAGNRVRVIGVIPDQIVTEHLLEVPRAEGGHVIADPERDLLKIAVVERHRATGNTGLGLVKGFGLKSGAIASTFAHDHHNVVVIGADDQSMFTAVRAAAATRGGMSVARGESVLAELPLSIAGLMSDQPIESVRRQMDDVLAAARQLGTSLHDPL
jgi:adenine deaminase